MFAEPLADYFALTEFAEDATWSVGPVTVQVIFDKAFLVVEVGTPGMASSSPRALVREVQVPGVAQGQTLTIRGTSYTIVSVEPDAQGIVDLQLRKTA